MLLGPEAQIKTKGNSICTLTFDENKKRLTLTPPSPLKKGRGGETRSIVFNISD